MMPGNFAAGELPERSAIRKASIVGKGVRL